MDMLISCPSFQAFCNACFSEGIIHWNKTEGISETSYIPRSYCERVISAFLEHQSPLYIIELLGNQDYELLQSWKVHICDALRHNELDKYATVGLRHILKNALDTVVQDHWNDNYQIWIDKGGNVDA